MYSAPVKRRSTLVNASAAVVGLSASPIAFAKASPAAVPFGLILKMKEDLQTNWQAALARVAGLAIKEVEFPSPVPLMKRHPGRFASFHITEPNNTPEAGMACEGGSFTNIATILRAGKAAGVKHFVIENEDPKEHYKCAARTLGYLKSLHV